MATTSPLNVPVPSIAELTGNSLRALQESLAQAYQAAGPGSGASAADLDLARSNLRALAFVLGAGLHGAYVHLRDYNARHAVPHLATGEMLDAWLATYGMTRKPAMAASGLVTGIGANGAVLPAGTLLHTTDGRQYRVELDAVVSAGAVQATVTALEAGTVANTGAGVELALITPVAGVIAEFASAVGIGGGADAETDAQAVYRLQQRLSAEPMGGAPADYARWALQVPGITRAWGLRNPSGPTTAGVIIMADANAPYGLPTTQQRDAVYAYISDPRRGPPDDLLVIIPTLTVVPLTVAITPDNTATRAGVVAAWKDLFAREAVPGGAIAHTHITEALASVVGETNHVVSTPALTAGGILASGGYEHLLVAGAVTFV